MHEASVADQMSISQPPVIIIHKVCEHAFPAALVTGDNERVIVDCGVGRSLTDHTISLAEIGMVKRREPRRHIHLAGADGEHTKTGSGVTLPCAAAV